MTHSFPARRSSDLSLALLVQDVERDLGRYGDGDLARAPAQAFLLDRAEDRERDPFGRAYMAGAAAMLADLAGDLHPARPHPLARQIGRASCRERVCQYVSIVVVAAPFKNKF